jgi:hypothetical protein
VPTDRINSKLKSDQSLSHSRSHSSDLDFEDDLDVEIEALQNIESIDNIGNNIGDVDAHVPKLKNIRSNVLPVSSSSTTSSSLLSSSPSAVSAISVPLSSTPLEILSLTQNHENINDNEIGVGSVSTRDEVVRAFATFVTTPSANVHVSSIPVAQKSKDKMGGVLGYGGDFSGVPTQLPTASVSVSASASVIPPSSSSSSSSSSGPRKGNDITSSGPPTILSHPAHSPSTHTPKGPEGSVPPTWSRSAPHYPSHTLSEAQAHAQSMNIILAVSGVLFILCFILFILCYVLLYCAMYYLCYVLYYLIYNVFCTV